MSYRHIPVMLKEVLLYLDCRPGNVIVDGTLGGSGHAKAILENILPAGILIGIDQDRDAIDHARKAFASHREHVHLFHGNFSDLPYFLSETDIDAVDGILLDLGLSQHHLESSGRGFSFSREEPLDMRMNVDSATKAEDLVNGLEEGKLAKLFKTYGEERWARRIAHRIVAVRQNEKIATSKQLAQIVCAAIPRKSLHAGKIHPATRVFMALRIAVNKELEKLETFLENVPSLLKSGGRLCILSFHSLEDRIVKKWIKSSETACTCPPAFPKCVCNGKQTVRSLTRKVIRPTAAEISANPMARSTRLRACEML